MVSCADPLYPVRWGGTAVSDSQSVTRWVHGVKEGNGTDIQQLWDRYFRRLVRLAGTKLPGHCRRSFDEEDVAISAFQSFCDRAGRGEFPRLSDRDDLWRLLATLTVRKAVVMMRHQTRQKRGGGHVLGESGFGTGDGEAAAGAGLAEVLGNEPTPADAAGFAEAFERLIDRLGDPTLKTIALRKLEGWSTQEIAEARGTSSKTVERKLRLIRAIWKEEAVQ
jgi:DNA-directed RNA polymerase specialized sigma24 family protein